MNILDQERVRLEVLEGQDTEYHYTINTGAYIGNGDSIYLPFSIDSDNEVRYAEFPIEWRKKAFSRSDWQGFNAMERECIDDIKYKQLSVTFKYQFHEISVAASYRISLTRTQTQHQHLSSLTSYVLPFILTVEDNVPWSEPDVAVFLRVPNVYRDYQLLDSMISSETTSKLILPRRSGILLEGKARTKFEVLLALGYIL